MSNFALTPGGWGDECWVISPTPVPESCTVSVPDLDGLLDHPIQDALTVPAGGVAQFRDMIQDMPVPPVERQAALHELLTPPAWTDSLISWWLIGSGVLTALALLAAVAYIVYDRRRRAASVEGAAS
ncbi:hypothetical protein [Mycobacteroides abscessus]|uniref:hypothetical protein n=1 Tax=Mycobacteroides abscessus TaxID=36809 RepID=UPI0019D2038A|nr:hypothetical protein [Mycobacteroides abscessus]MBN7457555.1 hypothetical protein [Mycobacteroides abscessus subsp. abscessus]